MEELTFAVGAGEWRERRADDPDETRRSAVIMLIARYSVEPGGEDEVAGWLVEMAGRVQRDEEGCLVYEVGRSKDAPGEFALYECYADSDAVAAHRTTAHYREIIEGKIVPRLTNRAVELFDPVAAMRRPARA